MRMHVVLGPPGPHAARLRAMLDFVGPRRPTPTTPAGLIKMTAAFSVEVHPLFGQDFLAVFDREGCSIRPVRRRRR